MLFVSVACRMQYAPKNFYVKELLVEALYCRSEIGIICLCIFGCYYKPFISWCANGSTA